MFSPINFASHAFTKLRLLAVAACFCIALLTFLYAAHIGFAETVPFDPEPSGTTEAPVTPWHTEGDATTSLAAVLVPDTGAPTVITFSASALVDASLEALPGLTTVTAAAATSSPDLITLTLSGLTPETLYHLYTDHYGNHTELLTDALGEASFTLDLSERHTIYIQPTKSTYFLTNGPGGGDCEGRGIGTWDGTTKTCTLTQDLAETVQIGGAAGVADGITLDGAGHTISGTTNGVYVYRVHNVTVTNIHVANGTNGIRIENGGLGPVTLSHITTVNNSKGVYATDVSSIAITDSTADDQLYGMHLYSPNVVDGAVTLNNIRVTVPPSVNGQGGYTGIAINYAEQVVARRLDITGGWVSMLLGSGDGSGTFDIRENAFRAYSYQALGLSYSLYDDNPEFHFEIHAEADGKPLIYTSHRVNEVLDATQDPASILACFYCNDVTIQGYRFDAPNEGLRLVGTKRMLVQRNVFSVANGEAIRTSDTLGLVVRDNTFQFAERPLSFTYYEGDLPYVPAQLYHNKFLSGALGTGAIWHNELNHGDSFSQPLPIGGNWWEEYDESSEGCLDADANRICDDPYQLPNASPETSDNLPWTSSNAWDATSTPVNHPPVITLLGTNPITVEQGTVFADPGATAHDELDGDLTTTIVRTPATVDTSVAGTTTVTYTVSDSQGLAAVPVTRTVVVTQPEPDNRLKVGIIMADFAGTTHESGPLTARPCKLDTTPEREYPNGRDAAYYTDLTTCVTDYYLENSYGSVDFEFTPILNKDAAGNVVNDGWFQLGGSYGYGREDEFIVDVASVVSEDQLLPYDALVFVHAGRSTQGTGDKAYMRTLAWRTPTQPLASEMPSQLIVAEDRQVGHWAHELGHVLGDLLPAHTVAADLYLIGNMSSKNYTNGGGLAAWALMALGDNNPGHPNAGMDPLHMNTYTKEFLGWLTPEIHTKSEGGTYLLTPMEFQQLGDKALHINLSGTTEPDRGTYYLLEARRRGGAWSTSNPQQQAVLLYKVNTHNRSAYGYGGITGAWPNSRVRDVNLQAVLTHAGDEHEDWGTALVKFVYENQEASHPYRAAVSVSQLSYVDAATTWFGAVLQHSNWLQSKLPDSEIEAGASIFVESRTSRLMRATVHLREFKLILLVLGCVGLLVFLWSKYFLRRMPQWIKGIARLGLSTLVVIVLVWFLWALNIVVRAGAGIGEFNFELESLLDPASLYDTEGSSLAPEPLPDLDLHAVTPDGRHIGMNYDAGEYENQIADAIASGDFQGDEEWIYVPASEQVRYYVSAHDTQAFFDANPDLAAEITDKTDAYELYAREIDPATGIYTSETLTDQPIQPGEEVSYTVIAGEGTVELSTDTTPPTTPSHPSYTSSTSTVTLTWPASTDDESGVAYYTLYRNGTAVGTTSSLTYTDTGLTPSTAYSYSVSATDNAGNESAQSPVRSAYTKSIPMSVSVTSSASSVPTGGSATITWSVSGYTSCTRSGGWSGTLPVDAPLSGSLTVSPTTTTTYKLTCTAGGSTGSASATVGVGSSGGWTWPW